MIKVEVYLKNDFTQTYDMIEISKEEILQLACNKARGNYEDGFYKVISAEEVEITSNL